LLARHGDLRLSQGSTRSYRHLRPHGSRTRQADARGRDLPHLLMSKPITAVALMMLVEEGLIGLDDAVHTYIPIWKDLGVYASGTPSLLADAPPSFMTTPVLRPMKVVDLATHTSGLTYGFMMRTSVDAAYRRAKLTDRNTPGGLQGMIDQLAQIPLDFSPGTA